MKIGITGGIACGKTTVLRIFQGIGFQVLNADEMVHELLGSNRALVEAIGKYFGNEVLNEKGGIDRSKLAERVLSDAYALSFLEGLLHPLVEKRIEASMRDGSIDWAVEIPLLFEKNLNQYFDYTICVITNERLQAEYLRKNNFSLETAELRVRHQMPLKEKILRADFVVSNTSSVDFLESQIITLMEELNAMRL